MPRGWGRNYEYNSKPRKACTAYNFFVQENYRYLRRFLRDRNPHRVLGEAANRWRTLPPDRKEKYILLAKRDVTRAAEEKIQYQKLLAEGLIEPPTVRQRVTKQPGYPRSTMNSFLHFANERRKAVAEEYPNYDSRAVTQELARRWKQMTRTEQLPYMRQRDADKQRYRAQKSRFREAKKEEKRKKRFAEGRERLNRLFHYKVPQPLQLQSSDGAEKVAMVEVRE